MPHNSTGALAAASVFTVSAAEPSGLVLASIGAGAALVTAGVQARPRTWWMSSASAWAIAAGAGGGLTLSGLVAQALGAIPGVDTLDPVAGAAVAGVAAEPIIHAVRQGDVRQFFKRSADKASPASPNDDPKGRGD